MKTRNFAGGINSEAYMCMWRWFCCDAGAGVRARLVLCLSSRLRSDSKICCFDFLASSTIIPSLDMFSFFSLFSLHIFFLFFASSINSSLVGRSLCRYQAHMTRCKVQLCWICVYSLVIVIRGKSGFRYTYYIYRCISCERVKRKWVIRNLFEASSLLPFAIRWTVFFSSLPCSRVCGYIKSFGYMPECNVCAATRFVSPHLDSPRLTIFKLRTHDYVKD